VSFVSLCYITDEGSIPARRKLFELLSQDALKDDLIKDVSTHSTFCKLLV